MMRLRDNGGRNPLVQRVQRYANMPAIFRAPDVQPSEQTPERDTTTPVAHTFIMPPHSVAEPLAGADGISQLLASQLPTRESGIRESTKSSPETAVSTPSITTLPTVQRTEKAAPTPPEAPEAGGLSRLKSVMQRVQRAISGEPAPPAEEPSIVAKSTTAVSASATVLPNAPAPIQTQPPPEVVPIPNETDGPIQAETVPVAMQPAPSTSPAPTEPISPIRPQTQAERDASRLDLIMRKHREAGTIETPPDQEMTSPETAVSPPTAPDTLQREPSSTQSTPPVQPQTQAEKDAHRLDQIMNKHREAGAIDSPVNTGEPPAEIDSEDTVVSEVLSAKPGISQKAETSAATDAVEVALPTESPDDTPTLVQKHSIAEETSETAVQRQPENKIESAPPPAADEPGTPLQAAWPVQVIEAPPSPSQPQPQPAPSPVADIMRQTTPEVAAKLQEQLNHIPPGQISDSSVQFIRPRKPRPTPQTVKTETIQREETAVTKTAGPAETSEATDITNIDDTVATEIGELPSDLWRLIGDEPPQMSRQAEPTTQSSPAAAPTVKMNERTTEPMQMIAPETVQPYFIQRTEAEQTQAEETRSEDLAPSSEAPPAPEAEPTETEQEAEVNMDELARQVYGEIKERMSIEWERTRGRF